MIWHDRLRLIRAGTGVSLKEMADLVGVTEATAQRYESGHIHHIPYEVIVAYAERFNVSPSYIMGWEDAPQNVRHPDEVAGWHVVGNDYVKEIQITEDELDLLERFRQLDPDRKQLVDQMVDTMLAQKKSSASQNTA